MKALQFFICLLVICILQLFMTAMATSIIKPTAGVTTPSNVVCAMTVCPTSTAQQKRDSSLDCPSDCPNDCQVINDVCCPGIQRAICKNDAKPTVAITSTEASGSQTAAAPTISAVSSGLSHSSGTTTPAVTAMPTNTAASTLTPAIATTTAGANTTTSSSSSKSANKWIRGASLLLLFVGTYLFT